eukprot:3138635-Rhodomonas_salina.2
MLALQPPALCSPISSRSRLNTGEPEDPGKLADIERILNSSATSICSLEHLRCSPIWWTK